VSFVGSAVSESQYPKDNLPQIVFSGRSNVGKSSFINGMLNRKKIARVSQTPGKTRLVNFFLINEAFYFVDIPGYGYANVSKKQLLDFQVMIEDYFQKGNISLCVLLLDIRRIPNEDDHLMYQYFQTLPSETLIVLTKSDKLSNNQAASQKRKIRQALNLREGVKMISFSSETMQNRDAIWDILEDNIARYSHE